MVVALGDDAAAHGRLVVGLEVDVVDVALELHGQRPGRPSVDKARPVACRSEDVVFRARVAIASCYIYELLLVQRSKGKLSGQRASSVLHQTNSLNVNF